ncbi:predicted protein [Naegleria gruberi]|uniref:Predicted protein n=1 Tax=Naegleria gruberi TaxID=5762 RepID=D2VCA5_NAEGR|nr:uncharacterized protein NAEGRDRAFT_66502 [Naegleria gruberi]EFC45620.1 predicted protein [Naegleria gruberi]|eukprot:XP_002678364.1 predicted protein [Naegleria gruberi strain NEG-M]
MINFYNKCEKFDKAIELFDSVPKDRVDTTSYNCVIQSYIGKGDLNRAIEILDEMQHLNILPNSTTMTIILTACADSKNYEQGLRVLNIVGESKLSSTQLMTSMINFYNKCEKFDKAIELFDSVPKDRLDTSFHNCLIQSYIGKGDLDRAFSIFNHMKEYCSIQPIIPDTTTYLVLLTGCADRESLSKD